MTNKFNVLDNGLLINKISKTYGNKQVVRDISISINRDGQVHINEDVCLEFYFLGGIKYENLKIFLHFLLENVSFKDFIQFRTGS